MLYFVILSLLNKWVLKIQATKCFISALQAFVKQENDRKACFLKDICLVFNIHKENIYKKQMQQIERHVMLTCPEQLCLYDNQSCV